MTRAEPILPVTSPTWHKTNSGIPVGVLHPNCDALCTAIAEPSWGPCWKCGVSGWTRDVVHREQ